MFEFKGDMLGLNTVSLLPAQQKKSPEAAEYKKTDEPQPDVKEEEEAVEEEVAPKEEQESAQGWSSTLLFISSYHCLVI